MTASAPSDRVKLGCANDRGSEERSRAMLIIGCDFHTRYQQIAMVDNVTGELTERRLDHENGEASTFYRSLPKPVRVGIEATGPMAAAACTGFACAGLESNFEHRFPQI